MSLKIIDFDETIAYTGNAVRMAYNKATYNITGIKDVCNKDAWEKNRGNSVITLLENRGFNNYQIIDIKLEKHHIFPNEFLDEISINNEMIDILCDSDSSHVVCTNSLDNVVSKILCHFKVMHLVDFVIGRNTLPNIECKPSPDMLFKAWELYKGKTGYEENDSITIYDDSSFGKEASFRFRDELTDDVKVTVIDSITMKEISS